jgi:hypothetical protein
MADFNINAQCQSNSKSFPKSQASISFHAAQGPVTLTFSPNPNCFGTTTSATANPDVTLTVTNSSINTTFTPSGCSRESLTADDTYDITFTSPEGGGKY